MIAAARQAHAHDFVMDLIDPDRFVEIAESV